MGLGYPQHILCWYLMVEEVKAAVSRCRADVHTSSCEEGKLIKLTQCVSERWSSSEVETEITHAWRSSSRW